MEVVGCMYPDAFSSGEQNNRQYVLFRSSSVSFAVVGSCFWFSLSLLLYLLVSYGTGAVSFFNN